MYELISLSEHDFYVDCPTKIGIVRISEDKVVLIDSGNDKDAGKKVLKILDGNGWKLEAIFVTHSHADHIGGCRFLQEKTGCPVYAKGLEAVFTANPILEPVGLYGGLPMQELKNKFLLAQECTVTMLTDDVLPEGMEVLSLPGHCFEMVGFRTSDGTAYIADSVSSPETLAKYGIGYLWNPTETVQTLEYLQTVKAKRFVPSHALVTEDISELVAVNKTAISAVERKILSLCQTPATFEQILKGIFDGYGLTVTAQQYALIGSTVRSYLSSLAFRGKITAGYRDNYMCWSACADGQ